MEAQTMKHKLFELFINYLHLTEYDRIREEICKFKTTNDKNVHEIFQYPINLDIIRLYDISEGSLCELMLREPLYVQHIINEVFLMLLKKLFRDLNKLHINQVDCPIIINPTSLLLPSNNLGLCNIEGILLEKSVVQKYLRSSTWICNSCREYYIKRCFETLNPQCLKCSTSMKEVVQDRKYRECVLLKIGDFDAAPDGHLIKILDSHVDDGLNFQLGAKYLITVSKTGKGSFKAWGAIAADRVPLPLIYSSEIVKLRIALANNPWAFAHELAERMSISVCPRNLFVTLKMGLLLSLCSTKTSDPIPIVVSTDDSNLTHKLMRNASEFSERCLSSSHLSNLLGSTKENWFCGGSFHIARNGICYLNDWNVYSKKCKRNIANVMESKCIQLNVGEKIDCASLQCAIWSYIETINKKATTEILTLSQVFGLIWRNNLSTDEEEELASYILNDNTPIDRCFNADIKKYIEYVNSKNVEISDEALDILQHYFITIRKLRGHEVPLTSFEPLQAMTEAHARINDRPIALIEDALLAIQLCEQNLGYSPLIPTPPKELILFKLWFQQYLGYKL